MRTLPVVLAALGAFGLLAASTAARADGWGDHDGWRRHEWREHMWREHEWRERHAFAPPVVYAPAPGYYAPPAVVYAPPPPVYGVTPSVSFGISFP